MSSKQSDDEEPFVIEDEELTCASELSSIKNGWGSLRTSMPSEDVSTGDALELVYDKSRVKKDSRKFQCDKCDVGCKNSYLLEVHRRSHSDERPHACKGCNRTFKQICHLRRHERKHQGSDHLLDDLPSQSSLAGSEATNDSCISAQCIIDVFAITPGSIADPSATECWNCHFCKKEFRSQHALLRHEKNHTNPLACKMCDKVMSSKASLELHCHSHRDDMPYHCDLCEEKFRRRTNLDQHKNMLHGIGSGKRTDGSIVCVECGLVCENRYNLVLHKRMHREGKPRGSTDGQIAPFYDLGSAVDRKLCLTEAGSVPDSVNTETVHFGNSEQKSIARSRNYKAFECSVCGKRLSSRSSLKAHTTIHTGLKPFECSDCEQSFLRKQELDKHLLKCHAKSPEAYLYSCTQCKFQTKHEFLVKRHQLKHTDIRSVLCNECGQLFKDNAGLKRHQSAKHKMLPSSTQSPPSTQYNAKDLPALQDANEHMSLNTFITIYNYGSLEMPIIWIEDFDRDVMYTVAHQSIPCLVCVRSLDLSKNSVKYCLSSIMDCDATTNIVWFQDREEKVYVFLFRGGKFWDSIKNQKFRSYGQLSLYLTDYSRSIQRTPINVFRHCTDDWFSTLFDELKGPIAITNVS